MSVSAVSDICDLDMPAVTCRSFYVEPVFASAVRCVLQEERVSLTSARRFRCRNLLDTDGEAVPPAESLEWEDGGFKINPFVLGTMDGCAAGRVESGVKT